MNDQQQKMLEEVVALSRQNSVGVNKLVRAQRRASLLRWVYWAIVIASVIAAYYSIQPYWNSLVKIYTGADIQQVIDSFKKK